MEIETRLESIDLKIEKYNEQIDSLSSLITSLIHTFQQNQLSSAKNEILGAIQEKFNASNSEIDIDEIKNLFNQVQENLKENQDGLKIKVVEVEAIINKINSLVENFSSEHINIDINEDVKIQLNNIEKSLNSITKKISALKNIQKSDNEAISDVFDYSKIDALTTLISSQGNIYSALQQDIENYFNAINNSIQNLQNISPNLSGATLGSTAIDAIKEKFDDLELAITSVLSAIKIIDKKYTELKSFQEVIDKLTTDVVSPILLASSDVRAFVEKTSVNFEKINEFVQEYDRGAFLELQKDIKEVSENVDKIANNVNIDVNRLFDLVDEFKTNSDLSNHTISDNMAKIESMLTTYNENLSELTKTATSEVITTQVKTLNDEFYLELLNLFNSLSFDDETEDIKDFIENVLETITYKTDENSEKLNNLMMQFKSLLYKIEGIEKTQNSISDYLKPEVTDDLLYSFDDIQSDLAKMRLVLNEISQSVSSSQVVNDISEKIKTTAEQIENLSLQLVNNENKDNSNLNEQIESLNTQIYDISLRTNKLLLTNEDSTTELKNNLEVFKDVVDKANPEKMYDLFYELTHYFNEVNEKINQVIDVTKTSHAEAVTIKNALVYVGEWLDSATTVLEEIRANTKKTEVKQTNDINSTFEYEISLLKQNFNQEMLDIKARLKVYEENVEMRLNNIEDKLDKLLIQKTEKKETAAKTGSTQLKNIDKKFVEIEKVLTKLSEKLMKD